LEKNGDLELKLRRLQDFAEETLISNQVWLYDVHDWSTSTQWPQCNLYV